MVYRIFRCNWNCKLAFGSTPLPIYISLSWRGQNDNDEIPKSDDLICGVISQTISTTILGSAKIGMEHRVFEAAIGQIYVVESESESDYILPNAWIDLEATGANDSEKSNYSLMVLEDGNQIVYAMLYKQPD